MCEAGHKAVQVVNRDRQSRLLDLAAGFASGTLEGTEEAEFRTLLGSAPAEVKAEVSRTIDTAALISISLPRQNPSADLRDKIFSTIRPPEATPELFEFVRASGEADWIPMKVPGAFVKLL